MGRARKPSPLPDNAIEPSPVRPEPAASNGQDRRDDRAQNSAIRAAEGERASADSRKRGATPALQATPPRDTTTVPDSVRDRFLPIRDKWYFENGDLAFQDHGTKLTTKSENHEIIRSFVAIAKTRGWEEISVVDGTKEFRRAIWHEASLQNIPVRGYTPTEIDEARLVQALARRREAERQPQRSASEAPETVADRPAAARPVQRGHREERPGSASNDPKPKRVLYGELRSHGAAPYNFDEKEDMSYYVKVKPDRGPEVTLWGKDLERALRDSKSQPTIGQPIGISHAGREPVAVPKKEKDGKGNVLREYTLKTHRNEWVIESEDFFRERAHLAELVRDSSVDAKRAVALNPALAGTYAALRGAELHAERTWKNDPHEQKRFVDAIRRAMVRDIKRGDPLYAPSIKDRDPGQERSTARSRRTPDMAPSR